MIIATMQDDEGKQIILLGLSRENVKRLTNGKPIAVDRKTHVGFPENLSIMVCFGETEPKLLEELAPLIGSGTTVYGTTKAQRNGNE